MKSILFYIFLMAHLISCSQVHNISQKTLGTYIVQMPGNIAVDPAGNELTSGKINAVIYLETSSKELKVKSALIENIEYKVTQQSLDTFPFMAGINYKSNEKVYVNIAQNNFLWKIELAPFPMKKDNLNQVDTITLKGTYQGKTFEQKIGNFIELAGIPAY